jgi:hypothetical protein
MIWAILALLGVPLWLCAMAIRIRTLVFRNRTLRRRHGTCPFVFAAPPARGGRAGTPGNNARGGRAPGSTRRGARSVRSRYAVAVIERRRSIVTTAATGAMTAA